MKRADVIAYLLGKPYAVETYPFDFVTPVYRVGDKMFALISAHETERLSINLKNKPEENEILRAAYQEIIPGYHQNKQHWITVYLDGNLEEAFIKRLIDDSYDIVYQSLTKKARAALEAGLD
jgi:predicted DNA-binding protein (MmcQ/YjbR family)